MKMMIWIILILALFGVACYCITPFIIVWGKYKPSKGNYRKWFDLAVAYFKARAELKLFVFIVSTEAGLAGVLPQLLRFAYKDSNREILFEIADNSDWLSFSIAIIIAVLYYLWLRKKPMTMPEGWDKIKESAMIIQDTFGLTLTPQWFSQQNDKAIRELGNRYSKDVNFPFEDMPWLLTALREGDGFISLMRSELNDYVEAARMVINIKREEYNEQEPIRKKAGEVLLSLKGLNDDSQSYINASEEINDLNRLIYDYFANHEKRDYSLDSLRKKGEKLQTVISNQWIRFKNSHAWFIVGAAGTGKSHLIGDIVTKRQLNDEPSILLLGEKFNSQDDPLTQIVALLDYPGRKEQWLRNLNEYGKANQKPVAIFIDGLNEKGGDVLWSAHLIGLIDDIERFEYLRLIVSFRISGARNWFYDMAYNHPEFTVYHHKGFEGKEDVASEFIFSSFGLDQPLWPAYGSEFANPLFLIKYCKVHEKKSLPLEYECFWSVILEYCDEINHDLAFKFHYDDSLHLVTNALKAIAQIMVEDTGRWYLEYENAIEKLTEIAKYTDKPKEFLRLLIDDGILRIESYKDVDYVDFGFEKVGDYFIAECLLEKGISDLDDSYRYGSYVDEALAVLSPITTGKEYFEIVTPEHKQNAFQAFIKSATHRDVFTEKGQSVIQKLVENGHEQKVLGIILQRPFRTDKHANSDALYNILWGLSMKERDALWTIKISETWGLGSHLNELAMWAMNASDRTISCVAQENIRLCAEALIWAFSSTWKELRDRSTHALVKILSVRNELVLPLLKKYYCVNDPYIEERLWASVLGSVVCSQNIAMAGTVAAWVYQNMFAVCKVPVHILVRDYAKSIIRYAQSQGLVLEVDDDLLNLPFSNEKVPDVIISCDEVKARYDIEWDQIKDDEEQRELHSANYRILSSMATEHSPRTSMYGDFGRYVFQANLSEIPVDPEVMANWAIEMIFEEFGYDAKLFAKFDIHLESYQNFGYRVERIGKKYQWIAMYRIMAVLEDVYKDVDFKRRWTTLVQSARNIDPTYKKTDMRITAERSIYKVPEYDVAVPDNDIQWMKEWKLMPSIEKYLIVKDNAGVEWVNLFSYNSIKKLPDAINDSYMQRDLWTFVQAYAVKKENLVWVCKNIHKYGLEGRRFRENSETDDIFIREFFWSDEYKRSVLESDYGFAPFEIGNRCFDDVKIAPAYLIYSHSSSEDASSEEGVSMLLPNAWLYNGMGLKYARENGVWVDRDDTAVVVDNSHYGKGHEALLVRKDVLQDYLNREGLTLFWPILTERQLWMKNGNWANHEQNGGWAYMDESGHIHNHFRCYELTPTQKKTEELKLKWKKWWIPKKHSTLIWLNRHGIIHLSEDKLLEILCFDSRIPSIDIDEWPDKEYDEMLAKMEKDGNIVDNDALAEQKKADWEKLMELASKYDDEDDELEDPISMK